MKLVLCATVVAALALSSCKSGGVMRTKVGPLYMGMSSDAAAKAMGDPDEVSAAPFLSYSPYFPDNSPGRRTIEWAWTKNDPIIVAWIDFGNVSWAGELPKARLEAPPVYAEQKNYGD